MVSHKDWRSLRPPGVEKFKTREAFCGYIAKKMLAEVQYVQARGADFRVVLSGGKTPIDVNKSIQELAAASAVDWSRVIIFFSDERCVPIDSPDSNYGMIRKTLLEPLKIPETKVFRFQVENGPEEAASGYERSIKGVFGEGAPPAFDLAILGMGPDGHVASLFPGRRSLQEKKRYAVPGGKGPEGLERVTLTYPLLNQCKRVWFVMRGAEKQEALSRLIDGPFNPEESPAQGICPVSGDLEYIIGDGLKYGR